MAIKFNQLTSSLRTEIKIIEPNENGEPEELVHSPKHKRLTVNTIQELDNIQAKIQKENKKAEKKAESENDENDEDLSVEKFVLAEQLAFIIEESDIWDGETQLEPSSEFYRSFSHNYLYNTFWGIMGSAIPTKKNSTTSDDTTSEAAESEANQVG